MSDICEEVIDMTRFEDPFGDKVQQNDQSIKADAGKPRVSLVPSQIIRDIAEVREYGLAKYGASESWRQVELQRYIDATYRHLLLFVEDPYGVDEESGISHYKHIACNLAFICEKMKEKKYVKS